jgi:hypothetical protein
MTPTPSPRHPWKALAVVLAMFAAVHGVRAHGGWHDHGFGHVQVVDSFADVDDVDDVPDVGDVEDVGDIPDIDIRIQDGELRIERHGHHADRVDDAPAIDVFDGAEWS